MYIDSCCLGLFLGGKSYHLCSPVSSIHCGFSCVFHPLRVPGPPTLQTKHCIDINIYETPQPLTGTEQQEKGRKKKKRKNTCQEICDGGRQNSNEENEKVCSNISNPHLLILTQGEARINLKAREKRKKMKLNKGEYVPISHGMS